MGIQYKHGESHSPKGSIFKLVLLTVRRSADASVENRHQTDKETNSKKRT